MSVENPESDDLLDDLPREEDSTGEDAAAASRRLEPARRPRLLKVLRGHGPFCVALALGAALRLIVMLGYPSAMFYSDSYSYLGDAFLGIPDTARGNGYAFFLRAMMPTHSFTVVTGLQALMGLVTATAIYLVLRRRGLPGWGATLCALPVLFDVYELQLEHMIASDVLFYTLLTVAIALLCFWDAPPWGAVVFAGALVGYAATVRDVGEAMLAVVVVALIARRAGWRRVVATAAAGVVPIAGYMIWFHSFTGQYAMNEAGPFLYGRVQSFADCSKMNLPADARALCDPRPPADREPSQSYVWATDQPLMKIVPHGEFQPEYSKMSRQFAEAAIMAQPLSYAKVVVKDTLIAFDWNRVDSNNSLGNVMGTGPLFQFEKHVGGMPPQLGASAREGAAQLGGADYGIPKVVSPWAPFLWLYQHVYLRGTFLLVILLIGLAGIVPRLRRRAWAERRWGGTGLLPWLVGTALVVLPPMTAGFSYRYVLAAVPALCLAAGLAFASCGNLLTRFKSSD